MKHSIIALLACLALTGNVAAQSAVPEAGLAAEGNGQWTDALRIYQEQTERQPGAAATWLRIADIEARLERPDRAISALQHAAVAAPGEAGILARLSQAYAAAGHSDPALHAIKGALTLGPDVEAHLRAAATIATWAGDYATATDAYRKLRRSHPQEHALVLGLARVNAWSGHSDAAASAYREYVTSPEAVAEAWLELARVESWRGNTAGALAALDAYRSKFHENDAFAREKALILARGARPRAALRELAPLLAAAPHDPALNVARTIALAGARRHGAALSTLSAIHSEGAPADTLAAGSIVRSLLGSNVGPAVTFYRDSDGLRVARVAPRADVGFRSDTRIQAGYEQTDLTARVGSGLESTSGASSASIDEVWSGASQRLGAFVVGGTVGQSRTERHHLTAYSGAVQFGPTDSVKVAVERRFGFVGISPRAVSLGLTRLTHRAQIDWTPLARYHVAVEGSYDTLSDANTRWELLVSPRAALARTQRLNLDAGVLIYHFRVQRDLDHGYYDPRRYEYYSAVVAPYWKVSDNIGVSMSAGVGPQRDGRRFTLGMNTSIETTFGIYREWMLKIQGSATNNRRLDSGAFRGTSSGILLLRRF